MRTEGGRKRDHEFDGVWLCKSLGVREKIADVARSQ